tara:strand:- start:737 stop:973 length:237 start_codon:yes stop_codon:yes gene_type:complete
MRIPRKKQFYIAYEHSLGTSLRTAAATDEASAIDTAKMRVSRSGRHPDAHSFRSVSRNKAGNISLADASYRVATQGGE